MSEGLLAITDGCIGEANLAQTLTARLPTPLQVAQHVHMGSTDSKLEVHRQWGDPDPDIGLVHRPRLGV